MLNKWVISYKFFIRYQTTLLSLNFYKIWFNFWNSELIDPVFSLARDDRNVSPKTYSHNICVNQPYLSWCINMILHVVVLMKIDELYFSYVKNTNFEDSDINKHNKGRSYICMNSFIWYFNKHNEHTWKIGSV